MLTPEDIKLMERVFATKEDLMNLASKEDVRNLQTSIDGLAKLVKDFRDEHVIIHKRLEVLEQWAKDVSKKLGISLPF